MKQHRFLSIVCIAALAVLACVTTATAQTVEYIYMTDGGMGGPVPGAEVGSIKRSNPDDTGLVTVYSGINRPRGIACDNINDHLYWNDFQSAVYPGNALTGRVNKDGASPITVLNHTDPGANDITLDVGAQKVYIGTAVSFANFHGVKRFNFDGTGVEVLYDALANNGWWADGIGLDLANGHVYWGDPGVLAAADQGILRMNLDGTAPVSLIPHLDGRGRGMEVFGGKLYFAEHPPLGALGGNIWRSNLDGTDLEIIVPGLSRPRDVALDPFNLRIYWIDEDLRHVQSATLDGMDIQTHVTGLDAPDSLCLSFITTEIPSDDTTSRIGMFLVLLVVLGAAVATRLVFRSA